VYVSEEVDSVFPDSIRTRRARALETALPAPRKALGARNRAEITRFRTEEDMVRSQQELGVCAPESISISIHQHSYDDFDRKPTSCEGGLRA
jgi:hypothetical protein